MSEFFVEKFAYEGSYGPVYPAAEEQQVKIHEYQEVNGSKPPYPTRDGFAQQNLSPPPKTLKRGDTLLDVRTGVQG